MVEAPARQQMSLRESLKLEGVDAPPMTLSYSFGPHGSPDIANPDLEKDISHADIILKETSGWTPEMLEIANRISFGEITIADVPTLEGNPVHLHIIVGGEI